MDIETQNLIDRLTEACADLERARDRLALQTGGAYAVDVSAARLITVAEDVMFYAEKRSREASEQIAYWADPVAARERMAAD